jgi:hypothetical protein
MQNRTRTGPALDHSGLRDFHPRRHPVDGGLYRNTIGFSDKVERFGTLADATENRVRQPRFHEVIVSSAPGFTRQLKGLVFS